MKLQAKTILIIAGIWLMICLGIYADAKLLILRQFQTIEDQSMYHDMRDTERAFQKMLEALALYSQAFSQWDDAYHFMESKNKKFIESNFTSGTYVSSRINFLIYFDRHGKLYYGRAYDLLNNKFFDIPSSLLNYFSDNKSIIRLDKNVSGSTGVINSKDGLIAISAQPVLTSDGKGPARGILVMGYYLTNEHFNNLAELLGLELQYIPISKLALVNAKYIPAIKLALNGKISTFNLSDKMAYSYVSIKDFNQKPVGVIQVKIPRVISYQGQLTTNHYSVIIIVVGLLIMLLLWYLLKVFILTRIISVSNQIHEIQQENRFNKKIIISGSDEISDMISSVNQMMEIISDSQNALRFMALHDGLTQLPNRYYFYDLLNNAIKNHKDAKYKIALMFIDLDHFKYVNDTYGHHIGDKLLQAVSRRLKDCIGKNDVLARQSGDEFLMFLPEVTNSNIVLFTAEKIINVLAEPFNIDHINIVISASIGISLYPDHGETVEGLLRKADRAMYQVKIATKNGFKLYTESQFVRN